MIFNFFTGLLMECGLPVFIQRPGTIYLVPVDGRFCGSTVLDYGAWCLRREEVYCWFSGNAFAGRCLLVNRVL